MKFLCVNNIVVDLLMNWKICSITATSSSSSSSFNLFIYFIGCDTSYRSTSNIRETNIFTKILQTIDMVSGY